MRNPSEWYSGLGPSSRRVLLGAIVAIEWILATEFVDLLFHFAAWFNWFQLITTLVVAVFVPPLVGRN